MALRPCSECGASISSDAKVCPQCGKQAPHKKPLSPFAMVVLGGLLLIMLLRALPGGGTPVLDSPSVPPGNQTAAKPNLAGSKPAGPSPAASQPHQEAPVIAPSGPQWQQLVANLWVGTELYLTTDKSFIGTVTGFANSHVFEDGSTRKAVQIRFKDGSIDWLPRETVQRIYVTKAR